MSSNLKVNTILPSAGSNIGLGTNGGNLNVDGGCKVQVGTALTLGHTVGVQFATQNLHSTGFEVNNVNASGIITASQFKGDGSNLTGISAGTSLSGSTNNTVCTVTGANAIQGESNVQIDSSGRLLIGTTTEGESTADDLTIETSSSGGITIRSATNGEGNIFFSDGTSGTAEYEGTIQYNHGSNYMLFFTNHAERLRINSNGKVGIATDTGSGLINTRHAGTNQQVLHVKADLGSNNGRVLNIFTPDTDNTTAPFRFQTGNGYLFQCDTEDVFTIAHDRRVGITETSPAGKLHIGGIGSGDIVAELTSGSPMFTYRNGSNTWYHAGKHPSDDTFVITQGANTTATELLRISNTGQLGVSHNLSGTSAYNRLMLHNPHDGSCWIQMTSTASGSAANTDGFSIGMNSSNIGHVWLRENAKMMFATNGTSRMEISAEGYISNSAQPMFGGHGFAGAGTQTQSQVPAFKFTTVYVNQGSHFNNSTGIFTCPVAGKYLVLACFAGRSDAYAWSGLYILQNGATKSDNWFPPAINTTSVFAGSHFTYAPLFSGSVYNCAANDTLVMGYHSGYSAPNNSSRNSLFIMLVG